MPIDAAFREVLKHRRDGARLRGWSLGWDRHSIEQTLTAANRDEFRRSALSRQLRSMFHHQEREVPVVVVNLEDPAMDVVQELAPVDGNGETLSVSDIAREAQGIGGRLPTAAVVHVLGCSTKDLPTPVQCCLCLGPRPTVAIVGCGHVCVCSDCCRKKTLALHFCPICRGGLVTKNRNLILQNIF